MGNLFTLQATAITPKAEFIERQIGFNVNTTITITVLDWFHDCSHIVFHWVNNASPAPVIGIDYLTIEENSHRIERSFSEFNVGALLFNAGFPECQDPARS